MAPPPAARAVRPRPEATESPRERRQPAALNDDLLEVIFLRVGSPTDLARASAVCSSFRRLITDRTFLRRYRSLHPPFFLGFVNHKSFVAVPAPHHNAPAANALGYAARAGFSFDQYLPPSGSERQWRVCDARDGRVLLDCRPLNLGFVVILPQLAVCDAIHRKHLLLSPIPEELLAGVQVQEQSSGMFVTCLAPCRYEDDETSFRVMGIAYCRKQLVVFVFCSGSCCWSIGMLPTTWGDLSFNSTQGIKSFDKPDHAYGCFYWDILFPQVKKVLKLDIDRMKLSIIDLPRDRGGNITIVEAGEGKLGMFSHSYEAKYVDYYTITQNGSYYGGRWRMANRIRLPDATNSLKYHLSLEFQKSTF